MAERTKQTRLEELDLRAKSLLEAWNKDTFGQRQQAAAGVSDSDQPFKRFAADHHKRKTAKEVETAAIAAFSAAPAGGGMDAFHAVVDQSHYNVGPPTLEERWDTVSSDGGPANEAKGGGSTREPVRSAAARAGFEYKGEQSGGAISIKIAGHEAFIPDTPDNQTLFDNFKKAYRSGDGVFDAFFKLADKGRMARYGAGTIRELYDAEFGDGNAPSIQAATRVIRNSWAQQDLKVQYDEGRDYRWTDSYYRYDVETPDLEFGNADDPIAKVNHTSFTLRRTDANTIELRKNIQRATVQNESGIQWPNKTEHGASTFTRSNSYDHRMQVSDIWTHRGEMNQGGRRNIIPTALAWPQVSSIPPNATPYATNRPAKNLEELWFSLSNIKTAGPRSDQVSRPGNDLRLYTFFGANRISNIDYKVRFLSALNGSFANVPGTRAVGNQGRKGFNVGQVAPYNTYGDYQFGDKREMDVYDSGVLHQILSKIHSYEQNLMEIKPGGNRINIVFNIRLNLNRLLQQNLLMPSDIHPISNNVRQELGVGKADDLATAIEEGTSSHIDDSTFVKLYLDNRSSLHAAGSAEHARTPPGTIAGVPVASLQGPLSEQKGIVADGVNTTGKENDNYPVFTFEEDYRRNNTITQDRGFIDNISGQVHGNRSGIAGLMPAVENDPRIDSFKDETSFAKSRGRGDEQFFPFMFETVNKKGSSRVGTEYKQYAYFQASLQSLNESYAPAWSSKHFFGRTEQIHTYTMTDRTIDLSFVIFATEIRRLQNLYERVSWLAQQAYPSYDRDNRIKSGPLIRMTIGDMFSQLTGFIRSLSFDWNYLGPGGKWEITQGLRIPMACTVTMNFTVMHDNMPDRNYAFYPGMLEGGEGLMGRRGKSPDLPSGGPLIVTADRIKDNEAETGGYSGQQEQPSDFSTAKNRNQQYIDQLYDNRSTGVARSFMVQNDTNPNDNIDDAVYATDLVF
jgi:hypothetical protein